jgi:hypothetical protein
MIKRSRVQTPDPCTVYWMDVSDASYYIKKRKIENKGSQMEHTKKIFKKKTLM